MVFIPCSCLNRRQVSFFLTRVTRIRVTYSMSLARCIRVFCSVLRACRASMLYVLCCMLCVTRSSCTCVLYRTFVTHPCRVFCVTRRSRICVIYFMFHVLCRALVVHVYSVSRARRTHIFCIARLSHICVADSVSRSSRFCIVCYVSRARLMFYYIRSSHLCLTRFFFQMTAQNRGAAKSQRNSYNN